MQRSSKIVPLAFFMSLTVGCGQRQGSLLGEGTSYTNNSGASAMFRLPDASKVVLMPGTRIVVATGFGKGTRKVEVDGEALFAVPVGQFDIETRDLQIEVLPGGGRFRVDAYRARPGEEVDLLQGGLRVRKSYHSDTDNEPEVLRAGEMVMINKDIDLMEKEKLDTGEMEKLKRAW